MLEECKQNFKKLFSQMNLIKIILLSNGLHWAKITLNDWHGAEAIIHFLEGLI